jgi:hypothetical protein
MHIAKWRPRRTVLSDSADKGPTNTPNVYIVRDPTLNTKPMTDATTASQSRSSTAGASIIAFAKATSSIVPPNVLILDVIFCSRSQESQNPRVRRLISIGKSRGKVVADSIRNLLK